MTTMFYVLLWWLVVLAILVPWLVLIMDWQACKTCCRGMNLTFFEYAWWCCKLQTILATVTTLVALAVLVIH